MSILHAHAHAGAHAPQPMPKDAQVLHLGGRTVIAREWHYPGQADACTLCPGCPIRGTGVTLCMVAVPGSIPAGSAALFRLAGPRLGIVAGDGGPRAE